MPLENGQRLGPYEIAGLLGRGGMGEVYIARDTRLERTVAVKTLNPDLSAQSEFRERFVREGRAISALNHPHICTLYDVGQTGDLSYLVMEHIAGASLADRLRSGPLPVVEALQCAAQVADALDHAHRRGVVHRDLKPSNIVLTKSGAKLLDFGIAKLVRASSDVTVSVPDLSSPTMTTAGTVVGTLHYMAPEQLQGLEVDGRSDLFSLGAVIYEMIVGAKAFDGNSQATIMAMIISGEPERLADFSLLAPAELERLVRRCLAKDPDDRWQTARDLRSELRWLADRLSGAPRTDGKTETVAAAPIAAPPAPKRNLGPWLVAAGALALAGIAVPWGLTRGGGAAQREEQGPLVQFAVNDPGGGTLALDDDIGGSAIAPDGTHLAIVASRNGKAVLTLRPLQSLQVRVVEGSEGAAYPFWSPDSKWIGFFAGEKLRKVPLSGGAPQTICDAVEPRGAAWGPDGTIVFAPASSGGLYRVSDSGGSAEPLTKLNAAETEIAHGWPHFLPGGKTLLFHVRNGRQHANHIGVVDVSDPGSSVRLVSSNYRAGFDETAGGRLLYVKNATLMAHAFDPAKKLLSGEPKAVAFNVASMVSTGYSGFSTASNGILVHRVGGDGGRRLRWVGRNGAVLEEVGDSDHYVTLRLSPDKDNLVISRMDSETGLVDLWLVDLARKLRTRLTSDDALDTSPVWSPDEKQIVYASTSAGVLDLYRKPLDDTTAPLRLTKTNLPRRPTDWSRDGQWIVYEEEHPQSRRDLWMIAAGGDGQPVSLLKTPFNEYHAQFSPDGKLLAYTSDDTGRPEVYVRGVQDRGRPLRVSAYGGSQPRWKRDGKELYYLSQDGRVRMVALAPDRKGRLDAAAPVVLFDLPSAGPGSSDYRFDVNDDGTRFLVIAPADGEKEFLAVTMNWRRLLQ